MPTSDPSVTDAPIFKPGDVVKVPFPYTDRPTRQRRPALIVSGPDLQRTHVLSWLLMITSATHRGWDGDVEIVDLARAGLPAPSIVRCAKVATIDSCDATYLGRVTPEVFADVHRHLAAMLAFDGLQADR